MDIFLKQELGLNQRQYARLRSMHYRHSPRQGSSLRKLTQFLLQPFSRERGKPFTYQVILQILPRGPMVLKEHRAILCFHLLRLGSRDISYTSPTIRKTPRSSNSQAQKRGKSQIEHCFYIVKPSKSLRKS